METCTTLAFTCNHIKTRQSQNSGASYMNACCSSPRLGEDTMLTEKRVRINNADGGKMSSITRRKNCLFGLRSRLSKLKWYDVVFSFARSHNGQFRLSTQSWGQKDETEKCTVQKRTGPSQRNCNLHCWIITVAPGSGAHTNDRWLSELEKQQSDTQHWLTQPVTRTVSQGHKTAIFAMANA